MAETLGRTLEEARRKLGKTVSEAESATFIRAKLLSALEAGEYDVLPNPAYVRGYIKNYAKFLELDPGPLLELYERETGTSVRQSINLPEPVVVPRAHINAIPPRTALIIVAVIGLIVLAVWGVFRIAFAPEPTPPLPVPSEVPGIEPGVTEPTGAPGVPDPSGEPTGADIDGQNGDSDPGDASTGPFTVRVVIADGEASWMRVSVDGLVAYEGTMVGPDSREWTVADEASLRIGRPSAVTVYRDDVDVEIPSGDPPTLTLTAE